MNFRITAFVFLLFTCIAAGMIWHVKVLQDNVVETAGLNNAKLYSDALIAVRSLYSAEVANTAQQAGLTVTHNYQDLANAIPLPATFSIQLGKKIEEIGSEASVRLYSPYPFPWRAADGGLRDEFSKNAWTMLNENPDQAYFRFQDIGGKPVLRYAVADRMQQSCVECHNNHPDTPRRDWQPGQVRGVLDLTLPLDEVVAATHKDLQGTIAIYLTLAVLGIVGILLSVARQRRYAAELEQAVARRTTELAQEKERAEKASQAKTEFLSRMSHELRTPLNAILGFGQLIEMDTESRLIRENSREILNAGDHLLDLINEILDLSRIESGRLDLNAESVAIDEILAEVGKIITPLLKGKQIRLSLPESSGLRVRADAKRLKQVLLNLLSNAIKYNFKDGEVEIGIEERANERIRINIRDTGIGLDEEQLELLFHPFERVGAENTNIDGAGIGLTISKHLTEAMGGGMGVTSRPGEGSTFWIELDAIAPIGVTDANMMAELPN